MKKTICQMATIALIVLAMSTSTRAASREWVGITDLAGDRLDVTASGTLPISSAITFATGTIGVSGTVTVQDGGGSLTVDGTVNVGTGTVNVGTLATISNPVTVTATALDVRPLTSADVVTATGTMTVTGSVDVGTGTVNVGTLATISNPVTVTGSLAITNTAFELTDGVDTAEINATGALYVEQVIPGTWSAKNYDVPTTTNSGANLDPDAPATAFYLTNESTSAIYVNISGTAADKTGLYVGPKGSMAGNDLMIINLSVYNTSGSAVAPVSILYADKRP